MLLFLLNNGANANEYTSDSSCNHVLEDATTAPQIIALLSYGADPSDSYEREYNYAIADNRWLHLVIYYFWNSFKAFNQFNRPKNIQELNAIVFSLPMLIISTLTSLLESQLVTEESIQLLPIQLRSFFDSLK